FLCKSNHKSVFLKLNMNVLLRHFKFTDFLLFTYADTLFGTLSLVSVKKGRLLSPRPPTVAGQGGTGDPRLRDPHKAICFAGTP
ncbi:MAG: hypothetical protein ILA23_06775, partial [Bacteroidales bacterium]|nr:hypothetical protein [Bacteroidales bacterium]